MAEGDSRLTNAARLLAAQEINRRQKEAEARKRLAKVEQERQEELAKLTRRKRELAAKARNPIERQRILDDIQKDLKRKSTKQKIAKIEKEAKQQKQKAIRRTIQTGGNIEVLTGRVAVRDRKTGRITGLSTRESETAIKAKQGIIREIQRREVERKKVTDLERFLENERRLASGQVGRKELDRQIAERKKRGLSKTPQQKRLDKLLRDQDLAGRLGKRAERKKGRFSKRALESEGFSATIGSVKAEREKALGRTPDFTNPNFISVRGAGRSFQARARDSSLGQIESQLALLKKKKTTKSAAQSRNESVALAIAQGNFFSGLSTNQLLAITSGQSDPSKRRKAQSAKSQRSQGVIRQSNRTLGDEAIALNRASPFAIIAQQDIPDPVTGVTDREVQLFRESIIESNKGKPKDKQERVPDTSEFFSSGRAPRADDPFNDLFGNFGGEDTTQIKERKVVDQGSSVFSDTQTEADIESARKEANKSVFGTQFVGDLPSGVTRVTRSEQSRRDKRARGLRAQGITGSFQDTFSVRGAGIDLGIEAPLQQSQTKRGGTPARQPQTFNVNLRDSIGISDSATVSKSKPKTTQKSQTQPRPQNQTQPRQQNAFGGQQIDLTFGLGGDIRQGAQGIQKGVQGVIDSPFVSFGILSVERAISQPRQTTRESKSAFDFLGQLASGQNPFGSTQGNVKLPSARDSLNSLGGFQI